MFHNETWTVLFIMKQQLSGPLAAVSSLIVSYLVEYTYLYPQETGSYFSESFGTSIAIGLVSRRHAGRGQH